MTFILKFVLNKYASLVFHQVESMLILSKGRRTKAKNITINEDKIKELEHENIQSGKITQNIKTK